VTERGQHARRNTREELHAFIDEIHDDLERPGLHATMDTSPTICCPSCSTACAACVPAAASRLLRCDTRTGPLALASTRSNKVTLGACWSPEPARRASARPGNTDRYGSCSSSQLLRRALIEPRTWRMTRSTCSRPTESSATTLTRPSARAGSGSAIR